MKASSLSYAAHNSFDRNGSNVAFMPETRMSAQAFANRLIRALGQT
jgi:hypothetical protein